MSKGAKKSTKKAKAGKSAGTEDVIEKAVVDIRDRATELTEHLVRPPEAREDDDPERVKASKQLVGGLRSSLLRVGTTFTPVTGKWDGADLSEIRHGEAVPNGMEIKAFLADKTTLGPVVIEGGSADLVKDGERRELDIAGLELSEPEKGCVTVGGPIPYEAPSNEGEG